MLKVLLKAHADVNVLDNDGWSPLMIAASKGHADVADLLIQHGTRLDISD